MNRSDADREIDEIERHAWTVWLQKGDARECTRCGQPYVPSRTSDPDLCAMCVPLRSLEVGDKSKRLPECIVCGGRISGRRGGTLYCRESCRKSAYRARVRDKIEDARTARQNDNPSDSRGDIALQRKGGQPALEEASTE